MELNAVVIFYSRYGKTESLALAAGVGAIQARANIRLRKVPEIADPQTIAADPAWKENLDRMNQEFIAPREIDLDWADVLVLAIPSDAPDEMNRYLDSLKDPPRPSHPAPSRTAKKIRRCWRCTPPRHGRV
jgi:NAD(P)H dehydrogenase (quinone)